MTKLRMLLAGLLLAITPVAFVAATETAAHAAYNSVYYGPDGSSGGLLQYWCNGGAGPYFMYPGGSSYVNCYRTGWVQSANSSHGMMCFSNTYNKWNYYGLSQYAVHGVPGTILCKTYWR